MSEEIMKELESDIRFRLRSWLNFHRKALVSFGDRHDGKHMLCQVCAKILMIDELLDEIGE